MTSRVLLALVYLWVGFTAGYFYRKWLEGTLLPRFRRESGTGPGPNYTRKDISIFRRKIRKFTTD